MFKICPHFLLYFTSLSLQLCPLSTRPGVSAVSHAPPATPNSLSSKLKCSFTASWLSPSSVFSNTSASSPNTCPRVLFTSPPTTLPSFGSFPSLPISSLTCFACCVCGNSEISLLKLTWGQCASTAMTACPRSWNAAWPDVSAMPKSARKSLLSVSRNLILYNSPLHRLVGAIAYLLLLFVLCSLSPPRQCGMLLFLIYFAKPVILCEWCLSKTSKAYMFTHEFGSADALVGLQYLFCINCCLFSLQPMGF